MTGFPVERITIRDWLGRLRTVKPGEQVLVYGEPEPVTVLTIVRQDAFTEVSYRGRWGLCWATTDNIRGVHRED